MSEFSRSHDYAAARGIRATNLTVGGPTYAARQYLNTVGSWDKQSKRWVIPVPSNNKQTAELLFGLTSRGLSWKEL